MEHLNDNTNELVATLEHPVPLALRNGDISRRPDLHKVQQETDDIIKQLMKRTGKCASNIREVCDDTDVVIPLIYFYHYEKLTCNMVMVSPVAGGTVTKYKDTAIDHKDIAHSLPGIHAMSGCDTTSYPFDMGKPVALKPLHSRSLRLLRSGFCGM